MHLNPCLTEAQDYILKDILKFINTADRYKVLQMQLQVEDNNSTDGHDAKVHLRKKTT